jgi:hypothetical protein
MPSVIGIPSGKLLCAVLNVAPAVATRQKPFPAMAARPALRVHPAHVSTVTPPLTGG